MIVNYFQSHIIARYSWELYIYICINIYILIYIVCTEHTCALFQISEYSYIDFIPYCTSIARMFSYTRALYPQRHSSIIKSRSTTRACTEYAYMYNINSNNRIVYVYNNEVKQYLHLHPINVYIVHEERVSFYELR